MSEKVLEAPCVFCGYNGSNYWQRGTHALSCPWRDVGGEADRRNAFPSIAIRLASRVAELEAEKRVVTGLYMELLFAVGRKYLGETRHETALRYIRQAEAPRTDPDAAARAEVDNG